MSQKKIFTVDGPCGSGKTKGLVEYLCTTRLLNFKNIIIQPTKSLCRQTYNSFIEQGYRDNIFILNSDNSVTVTINVIEKIKDINKIGKGTLIITQEAYNQLKYFPLQETWRLYIDETPAVDSEIELLIPYNTHILKEFFDVEDYNDKLYKLTFNSKNKSYTFLNRSEDKIDDIVRPLIKAIDQDNIVYTKKDSWDRIVKDRIVAQDVRINRKFGNKKNKLYFLIINNIERYHKHKETTLLAANIKNSIFYEYGLKCGIEFIKHEHISKHLKFDKHLNGELVTIYYMQDKRASN
ncbi:MAG: DEAD/DEAH box helicase family protein, partial [Flavobacterium sp.]|uniref:DEAD/DEAH box helicase family protein n=1 Tax=Flavobacterium sp. TaxID=239 RepID=UPI00261B9D10